MSSTLIRPKPGRLKRSTRRTIVTCFAITLGAGLIAMATLVEPDSTTASILKLAIALGSIVAIVLAMTRSIYWFVGNAPDTMLDERERALRDRSYFKAYGIYAGITVLAGFYFLDIGPDFGLWMPTHEDQWWALMWGMLVMALTAPAAFVAWDEADPEIDA